MTEWQRLQYEIEAIEREMKLGATDTPDGERYGHAPLMPEEKDRLCSRIMEIHRKMNAYIAKRLMELRNG